MRCVVLQIEDRDLPMQRLLLELNRFQSHEFGFEHDWRRAGPLDVPPYWWKVFALRDLLEQRPEVDLVLWMDSDAFLPHYRRRNPVALARGDPTASFWLSPDAPPLHRASFCAGAFLVRNDARGRAVCRRWADLYRPS